MGYHIWFKIENFPNDTIIDLEQKGIHKSLNQNEIITNTTQCRQNSW